MRRWGNDIEVKPFNGRTIKSLNGGRQWAHEMSQAFFLVRVAIACMDSAVHTPVDVFHATLSYPATAPFSPVYRYTGSRLASFHKSNSLKSSQVS